jgi:hypothetical protein
MLAKEKRAELQLLVEFSAWPRYYVDFISFPTHGAGLTLSPTL